MHIDSYSFGKVVIDGRKYSSDCLIIGDYVRPGWRRKRGHLLSDDDLKPVIEAAPEVLVIGCGASGAMRVPDEVVNFLAENGIESQVHNTGQAVRRFNQLKQKGLDVAAAFHLTC